MRHNLVRIGLIPEGRGFSLEPATDEETDAYRRAMEILENTPVSEEYGFNRLIDYFKSDAVLLTNSFDIYKREATTQAVDIDPYMNPLAPC
jgi:hypothetical protein